MTTKYYFYTAGALPIIGGIYAGVVVEVDEAHTKILSITPLGQAVIVDVAQASEATQPLTSPEASPSIDIPDTLADKES